jgi:hypothetical protein
MATNRPPAAPTSTAIPGGWHFHYPDGTSITSRGYHRDHFGQEVAVVELLDAEGNLLQGANCYLGDHDKRVRFCEPAISLNGQGAIDWNARLLVVWKHYQEHGEADGSATHEPAASTWEIFSLADAYSPRDPMVELVEGLFPLPSLAIVYGAPGTLKSFLLLDLEICLAAGPKVVPGWLCPLTRSRQVRPRMIRQASTLWVDFDNGPRRMHERAAAIGRAYDLPPAIGFHYVSMPNPWLDASQPLGLDPLRAAIEHHQAKMIVLDNLLLIKGNLEENSADMGIVMAHLRHLTEEYGALVVPIHHQRKDQGGRSGDRIRGHSSIEAAVDLALLVEREEGSDTVTVRSTKTRDVDVPPFAAMFTYEHQDGSTELSKARFFGLPQDDKRSDRAIEQDVHAVLTAESRLVKTELCGRVHAQLPDVGINRIRNIVERMIAQHRVHVTQGDRNSQWVSKCP